MKTLLDEFYTCFLHATAYRDGDLHIIIAEGFKSDEPEDLQIAGHTLKDVYAIEISDKSRHVDVHFSEPIAWQCVDESYFSGDETEECEDESSLRVLTRSKYLDFVRANHGLYEHVRGPGKHYRVWTQDEVIDVVACEPPAVSLWKPR